MIVIISYDIEEDKKRTRLANKLKDFGFRVQYSVFEADIKQNELKELKKLLKSYKLTGNDSIRLYQLCESCVNKIKIWGIGEVMKDKEIYIV